MSSTSANAEWIAGLLLAYGQPFHNPGKVRLADQPETTGGGMSEESTLLSQTREHDLAEIEKLHRLDVAATLSGDLAALQG